MKASTLAWLLGAFCVGFVLIGNWWPLLQTILMVVNVLLAIGPWYAWLLLIAVGIWTVRDYRRFKKDLT